MSENAQIAGELRHAVTRIVRRLRAASAFPLPQAAVLNHLDRIGTSTVGELAAIEAVRAQSMAQTVSELEAIGLVQRSPDPADGRGTASARDHRDQRLTTPRRCGRAGRRRAPPQLHAHY